MIPQIVRMRILGLAVAVLLAAFSALPQTTAKPTPRDLSSFTFAELTACYKAPKTCNVDDVWEISDEFARRLPTIPSDRLLACFDDWKICGIGEGRATGWPISDELARRGQVHDLLVLYWKDHRWAVHDGIEHVAYHFDTPEVTEFMRRVLAARVNDGEDLYWPVNYLAKKCDPSALKELSTGRYRNQGSLQYQTSVELFGKCKYRPAIPYLVDSALNDVSWNIAGAADDSLHALYPDAPKDFDSLEKARDFYCRRAHQEGAKVSCKIRPTR